MPTLVPIILTVFLIVFLCLFVGAATIFVIILRRLTSGGDEAVTDGPRPRGSLRRDVSAPSPPPITIPGWYWPGSGREMVE